MSAYGWIIDKDHYPMDGYPPGNNFNAPGVMGPGSIEPEVEARLLAGEGERFRMYDDDKNIMYEGRFIGDSETEEGFGPLDDFGRPNAGAVDIYYKRGKTWEIL